MTQLAAVNRLLYASLSRRVPQTAVVVVRHSSTIDTDSSVDPSRVDDRYRHWVINLRAELLDAQTYGKWMVFKTMASQTFDETWHTVRRCVESGEFGVGCTAAKYSTTWKNRSQGVPVNFHGHVGVYTSKEAINEVGMLLVRKVCQTIRYKTVATSLLQEGWGSPSSRQQLGKSSIRTIYWNDGEPIVGPRKLPADMNPTSVTDDYWVYCDVGPANSQSHDKMRNGKWMVREPMKSLDETWHSIRRAVEGRELGEGCTGARCSTALRPYYVHPDSEGAIFVSTTKEGMSEVGMLLVNKVQRDIVYRMPPAEGDFANKRQRTPRMWVNLYWNNGDPKFSDTLTM